MAQFLQQNWIGISLIGVMLAMHLGGHRRSGGQGGHGGHGGLMHGGCGSHAGHRTAARDDGDGQVAATQESQPSAPSWEAATSGPVGDAAQPHRDLILPDSEAGHRADERSPAQDPLRHQYF